MTYLRYVLAAFAVALLGSVALSARQSRGAETAEASSSGLNATLTHPASRDAGQKTEQGAIFDESNWDIANPWRRAKPPSENHARTYVIRVIDSTSRQPISHAKVWVEIGDPPEKRNGYTNERGAFSFQWRIAPQGTKSHITVECQGYTTVDDSRVLIEDRIIQLTKIGP